MFGSTDFVSLVSAVTVWFVSAVPEASVCDLASRRTAPNANNIEITIAPAIVAQRDVFI